MATSYDNNERSTSQNRPVDLYTFVTPTVTYRLTSNPVDVSFGGNTFTATAMSRDDQQITQDPTGRELTIYLPISHPLVQRYAASGLPEHGILVTVQRLQTVSGVALQYRNGYLGAMSVSGHMAQFRLPELTDDAFKIQLPIIAAHPTCNHILYDGGCSPNPGVDGPNPADPAYLVTTTLGTLVGTALTVASIGGKPDHWFQYGDAVHVASSQRRMMLEQAGTAITLMAPFVGASPGDSIQLYAGCDHSIITCVTKFVNRLNFGGHPQMNSNFDYWNPNGLGVIQQF